MWEHTNVIASVCSAIAALASCWATFLSWRTAKHQLALQVYERRVAQLDALAQLSTDLTKNGQILADQVDRAESSLRLLRAFLPYADVDELSKRVSVLLNLHFQGQAQFTEGQVLQKRKEMLEAVAALRNCCTVHITSAEAILNQR